MLHEVESFGVIVVKERQIQLLELTEIAPKIVTKSPPKKKDYQNVVEMLLVNVNPCGTN